MNALNEVGHWVYYFQGLLGGILALIAAIFSLYWISRHRADSIRRKNHADRAGMSKALSDIITYSRIAFTHIDELHNAWKQNHNGRPFTPTTPCPEYPHEAFSKIQSVIENSTKKDAKLLVEFISLSQIQSSRLQGFLPDLNRTNPNSVHLIIGDENFYGKLFDAIGIYKFTERMFEYARLQSDAIMDICDSQTSINTLSVSFSYNDEALSEIITSRWPPSIH